MALKEWRWSFDVLIQITTATTVYSNSLINVPLTHNSANLGKALTLANELVLTQLYDIFLEMYHS